MQPLPNGQAHSGGLSFYYANVSTQYHKGMFISFPLILVHSDRPMHNLWCPLVRNFQLEITQAIFVIKTNYNTTTQRFENDYVEGTSSCHKRQYTLNLNWFTSSLILKMRVELLGDTNLYIVRLENKSVELQ